MGRADMHELAEELRSTGLASGLDAVGIAPAEAFLDTRRHLQERRAAGLHGGMAFTYRNPERSTDPGRTLPGARALVVGALSYGRSASEEPDFPFGPAGRVARYSWRDYYAPLRRALGVLAARLGEEGWATRVVADDNALVDREAAYRAGLGWYGKNSVILLPGRGSWFVLGSVVTDAPLPATRERVADACGACTRCLRACPTGALVAPGVHDARRCLAWVLEAPGPFPRHLREALGDRVYGCDDCQEVCPPNRSADRRHPPSPPSDGDQPWVDLVEMLTCSDTELLDRFGRWYIPRRHPRYLRRNALVALGNVADGTEARVEAALVGSLASDDALVRAHAVWAAGRLGRLDLLRAMAPGEEDEDVVAELRAVGLVGAVPTR